MIIRLLMAIGWSLASWLGKEFVLVSTVPEVTILALLATVISLVIASWMWGGIFIDFMFPAE